MSFNTGDLETARGLYLELMKKCLSFTLWDAGDGSIPQVDDSSLKQRIKHLVRGNQAPSGDARKNRMDGRDWPMMAHTMIGWKRLNNLQYCVETAIRERVPGDVIETGVWRGGATILMRAILKAYGEVDRTVWVADSFEGLPKPQEDLYPEDAGDIHHRFKALAVSIDQVKANFEAYGLLDDQVKFLKGWFRDTLPGAPIEKLAVARLDGDMYESTMDGLENLYPKLSQGGFLIVDDYGAVPACKKAVEDYRSKHGITDPIEKIDQDGVYWRRTPGGGGT